MTDNQQSIGNGRWQRWVVVVLIAIIISATAGPWWINHPKQTAEHFIALVAKGQFDAAKVMLHDSSSMAIDPAGNLTLRASDGTTATLTKNELPLVALDDFYSRPPRRDGIGDYIIGRYQFEIATAGSAIQSERQEPIEIYADAVRGVIVLVTIKEH